MIHFINGNMVIRLPMFDIQYLVHFCPGVSLSIRARVCVWLGCGLFCFMFDLCVFGWLEFFCCFFFFFFFFFFQDNCHKYYTFD